MTIRNVTIGDKFRSGKHLICEVVDFYEVKSMVNGNVVDCICVVKGINSLAKNEFTVPFSTVTRNRIDLIGNEKYEDEI